jgi:hypothetical protein
MSEYVFWQLSQVVDEVHDIQVIGHDLHVSETSL